MEQRNDLHAERAAAYDAAQMPEARTLVARAFAALDRGFPADPKVDRQRRERAARVRERIPDHARDFITRIVAQWLSARAAPSAAPAARQAAEGVADIMERIAQAHASLHALAEALQYSDTTEAGQDAQGLAQVIAGSLADAGRALSHTQGWSEELVDLLPIGARGQTGVVGKLSERSVNDALAIALGREWLGRGLSLSGGKNKGDGLDIILEAVIGSRKDTEAALSTARRELLDPRQ